MDWNDLRYFLAVARGKSLSSAAAQWGVSASTISRRIDALEAALQLALFRRHRDGYDLTDAGNMLVAPAEAAEAHVHALERIAKDWHNQETLNVRIDAPELLGQLVFLPALAHLMQRDLGLRIDLGTSVQSIRLAEERADIVVRLVRPEKGNYVQRRVGRVKFSLYASPTYLSQQSTPASSSELCNHQLIGWTTDLDHLAMAIWWKSICPGMDRMLRLTTLAAQVAAAQNHMGIALLPVFAANQIGLVQVLPELPDVFSDLWLLVHKRAINNARVRAVSDTLATAISKAGLI